MTNPGKEPKDNKKGEKAELANLNKSHNEDVSKKIPSAKSGKKPKVKVADMNKSKQ